MFSVTVNIDGIERKMNTLANTAGDLSTALKRMGGHLKARAQERYEAQSFAPLAQSTLRARAQEGLRVLERKLETDYRKAKRKAFQSARDKRAPRGAIATALARLTLSDLVPERASVLSSRGVQNRLKILEEFRRRHRGGEGGAALSEKQAKSLGDREARAIGRQVGKPILGGLSRTLVVRLDGRGSVTLWSRTFQHFSDVHNRGGSAGHGAKIPQRMTVTVDDHDIDVFIEILREELLLPIQDR